MSQVWRDLLFVHWPVPVSVLRSVVPAPLTVEEHGGTAWVGLTPFLLTDLRVRGLPPVPGASRLPKTNLRTYVRHGHTSGIFFFSLDAGSRLAVAGARLAYRLPYRHARMRVGRDGSWITYRSRRTGGRAGSLVARYRPVGSVSRAREGSLEHFLTERYVLFSVLRGGRVLRGDIRHRPWPLSDAEAEIDENTIPSAQGLPGPGAAPLLHFARRQDVIVWRPQLSGRAEGLDVSLVRVDG